LADLLAPGYKIKIKRSKPNKWGYKIFVLSGVSGFSYNFEVYSGLENNPDQRLQNEPNLGASANIVVRLARIIPKNQNYKLYFDNYYTTLALEVYFKKMVYTVWAHYEEIEFLA